MMKLNKHRPWPLARINDAKQNIVNLLKTVECVLFPHYSSQSKNSFILNKNDMTASYKQSRSRIHSGDGFCLKAMENILSI